MMTSLISGLPSRETCRNGPLWTAWPLSASHRWTSARLAARRRPDPDHRARVRLAVRAAAHQAGDGYLDGDRVHVDPVGRVHARRRVAEHVHAVLVVQLFERPQVAEVEDGAEIDVEPLG